MSVYRSSYGVSRFIARFIAFLGWMVTLVGSLGIFMGLTGKAGFLMQRTGDDQIDIILSILSSYLVYVSIVALLFGLMVVACGQITRAVVDTADYNGEMVSIMRERGAHNNKGETDI